ncbi:MAG: DNA alkylation repair protein [Cyclobacteriaceae bacterium]|nr:DNA alkylation repair protein [Cyclobacteriaceae bacterium]
MKQHLLHDEILKLIRKNSGKPTQHTFLDSYLGNSHPRYPINAPTLRKISKDWMKAHRDLSTENFQKLLLSLVKGKSSTEKVMVGALLDDSTLEQRRFNPEVFDQFLDHLEGWAEVDSVCTGAYTKTEIPRDWKHWKKLLTQFSKSKNIQKRRASLVFLCSPIRIEKNAELLRIALKNIDKLKAEKEILITKAISWLLRSAVTKHSEEIREYLLFNKETLPKIAVRETIAKLETGRKTKKLRMS